MERISVLVVDDHPIIREGVRMMLDNDTTIEVVGEASNVDDALVLLASKRPTLLVLDQFIGQASSIDRLAEITAVAPGLRVLIFTGMVDIDTVQRAAAGGAHGVVLKSEAASSLLKAIKKVASGEVWYDRFSTAKLIEDVSKRQGEKSGPPVLTASLTPREVEIVMLIIEGLVNKDIAKRLSISEKTVRNHLTVIYSKLGVTSRLELAILANQTGMRPHTA